MCLIYLNNDLVTTPNQFDDNVKIYNDTKASREAKLILKGLGFDFCLNKNTNCKEKFQDSRAYNTWVHGQFGIPEAISSQLFSQNWWH